MNPVKIGRLVAGLLFVVLLLPAASLAHTYASDGPIRVLLHTDPDDNPPTQNPTELNFTVFDETNQFLGSHCDCVVTVTGSGKTILKKTIFTDKNADKNVTAVPVIFPRLGTYTVNIAGQPKPGSTFHPFNLNYSVPVTTEGTGRGSMVGSSTLLGNGLKLLGIYVAAAIVITAIVVVSTRNNRKKQK